MAAQRSPRRVSPAHPVPEQSPVDRLSVLIHHRPVPMFLTFGCWAILIWLGRPSERKTDLVVGIWGFTTPGCRGEELVA